MGMIVRKKANQVESSSDMEGEKGSTKSKKVLENVSR